MGQHHVTPGRADEVGGINLDPPEPKLDARHLDRLIELWLDEMAGRLRPETAEGYAYKLLHFREWWARVGPDLDWRLGRRDLERFARELCQVNSRTGEPLSYHSRNDVHRRLRQMFKWAFLHGYTEAKDYSGWVPVADGEAPRRSAVSVEALAALFEAAGRSPHAARDRAILAVFIGTGVRRAECARLTVEDLAFHADGSGSATVHGKRTRANESGIRQVAFDAATGHCLSAYLDAAGLESGPLWPGGQGPLSTQGIYRVVKRCIAAAGLEGEIQACHDLRRAFATHFARSYRDPMGADLLRRQMGHTTYRMSSHYTLLDVEDIRDRLHSPMAAIELRRRKK